jgi:hypothetical protein
MGTGGGRVVTSETSVSDSSLSLGLLDFSFDDLGFVLGGFTDENVDLSADLTSDRQESVSFLSTKSVRR